MILCNCSDNAWNKQFPNAGLSETKNPLLAAIVLRSDRLVFLLTCSASHGKFCEDGKTFQAEKKKQKKNRYLKSHFPLFYSGVVVTDIDNFWDPIAVINLK